MPGALSSEYNTGVPYDNMCDLCHGTSYRYCRRDASEDYFGFTGKVNLYLLAMVNHFCFSETDSDFFLFLELEIRIGFQLW